MPTLTKRRMAGAAAVPALALALAACGGTEPSDSGSDSAGGGDASAATPHEAILASYDSLGAESYKMESAMTVNGLDFMDMVNYVDGESAKGSQDMYMSAILEATGDDYSSDPEMAEMMEEMFGDMHTETVLVDQVLYMQLSGGMFSALADQFGEDAWFTMDLTEDGTISDVYEQIGSFDLASQTETLLGELSDVEETGDGVYTGTLDPDSETMRSMLGATGGASSAAEGIEITITVDGDGLLESMAMTFPETEGMTMEMVSEVVEIGGDYDIAAPESDNLHSFDEFSGAF